jgi:Lon protease-like protein
MLTLLNAARAKRAVELPLFPLKTVLFPGGVLPLKVFEQRYIEMTKSCLGGDVPFGVCLVTQGEEVARAGDAPTAFAAIGTLASITSWDMPEQGILHVSVAGGTRFRVLSHQTRPDGLVVGTVAVIAAEPAVALPATCAPLARLLEALAERVGPQHFPRQRAFEDASWVGYRLAELLPLPLHIKQTMLEVSDSEVRLAVLQKFLQQRGLV